ncbi:MAG: ATP-binding protein [Candidatus Promineifilaceae bacterium]
MMMNELERSDSRPEVEPTTMEDAIANSQRQALRPTALGAGLLYAFIALSHALTLVDPFTRTTLTIIATISTVIFTSYYTWTYLYRLPLRYAHQVAALFALVAIINSVAHVAITGDPKQSTNLIVVIMAVGSFFLSWPWFASAVSVTIISWGILITRNEFNGDWFHFGFGLATSIVVSFLIHNVRLNSIRRLHKFRLENVIRRDELSEIRDQLEQRVQDRTAQLSRLNSDLAAQVVQRQQVEAALRDSEAALKIERESLARRVAQQTGELRLTNAELTRANRLKDEFLATMSHELRTPLNSILGNSEILGEELVGPLNERQHGVLGRVGQSARHLLNLINDILDVSKIGAGKLTLDIGPVEVKSLCEGGLSMIRPNANKKSLEIIFEHDPAVDMIVADGRRIKQVIVNLLSNAVKFTPKKGRVGLVVRGFPKKQQVQFAVWDTGIGIRPEDQQHLFEPFVQADGSLSREHEGTGLGLALSKRLVQLHNGEIRVKSVYGKGSLFVMILPWLTQEQPNRAHADSAFNEMATYIADLTSNSYLS